LKKCKSEIPGEKFDFRLSVKKIENGGLNL
jgi:hypothetical protein